MDNRDAFVAFPETILMFWEEVQQLPGDFCMGLAEGDYPVNRVHDGQLRLRDENTVLGASTPVPVAKPWGWFMGVPMTGDSMDFTISL
jgi:hypothetical protein